MYDLLKKTINYKTSNESKKEQIGPQNRATKKITAFIYNFQIEVNKLPEKCTPFER